MKCLHDVTYTLKINRETIKSAYCAPVRRLKRRTESTFLSNSKIISISIPTSATNRWKLAYLTLDIVILYCYIVRADGSPIN